MNLTRALLVSFFLLYGMKGKPHTYKHYYGFQGRLCHEHLILSDDSLFFYAYTCESKVSISKGKWSVRKNKMILLPFSDAACFPSSVVRRTLFVQSDSVRVCITDYFGKPYTNMMVAIFDSLHKESFEFLDSIGTITLSKSRCKALTSIYEYNNHLDASGKKWTLNANEKANNISISVDWPNEILLEGEVNLYRHLLKEYIVVENELCTEDGKVIFSMKNSGPEQPIYDDILEHGQ